MSKRTSNQPSNTHREIVTPDGFITMPPGSPKILVHTRQGKCVGIYCDQPAKVLTVETQGDPRHATESRHLAFRALICPQTSIKVVDGYGTAVDHVLAMPFDDPLMDDDLCQVLTAHEVVLDSDWPDIW